MKKKFVALSLLLISYFFLLPNTILTYASNFSGVVIRPENMSVGSSPLPLYVQVTIPIDAIANEDEMRLIIPSAWSINSSAVAISTTGIPSGVNSWPGLSIIEINGQIIRFASNDLIPGATYGFFITNGIGNNPNLTQESQWTVSTLQNGGMINQQIVAIPTLPSGGNIAIIGEVEASASNFFLQLSRVSPSTNNISAGENARYKIKYSHSLPYPTILTIQASWSSNMPVMSYVVGSASSAFGNTSPIVNTNTNTITWTTTTIPVGSGEQEVEFSLQGNTINVSNPISVTINSRIIAPTFTNIESDSLNFSYQQPGSPTPFSTPSSLSQASPTPTFSQTVQPMPTSFGRVVPTTMIPPQELFSQLISKVEIISLNSDKAVIRVWKSINQNLSLIYKAENGDDLVAQLLSNGKQHQDFLLTNLRPNQTFYYWFIDPTNKQRLTKETFQFLTPMTGEVIAPIKSRVHVLYQGHLVNHWDLNDDISQHLLVRELPYVFSIKPEFIDASIQNSWLELWYEGASHPLLMPLQQTSSHQWQTPMQFPEDQHAADIYIYHQLHDGNQLVSPLGKINIAKPLKIIDAHKLNPLEHVLVEILFFDVNTQLYKKLDLAQLFTRSNVHGIVPITLPAGKYRLNFTLQGYFPQTLDIFWPLDESDPPVALQPTGSYFPQFWGQLTGFSSELNRVVNKTITPLFGNVVISKLALYSSSLALSIIVLVFVSLKTHVEIHMLPIFIWSHFKKKSVGQLRNIVVLDRNTGQPIPNAEISILNSSDQTLELQALTNHYGALTIRTDQTAVEISVSKKDYITETATILSKTEPSIIKLTSENDLIGQRKHLATKIARLFFGLSIEIFLLLALLLQIGVMLYFGWSVAPMVIVTALANLAWWIYHSSAYPHVRIE